jgi:hypothetical protein
MIEFMLEINGMIDNNKPSSEHHERERERERVGQLQIFKAS